VSTFPVIPQVQRKKPNITRETTVFWYEAQRNLYRIEAKQAYAQTLLDTWQENFDPATLLDAFVMEGPPGLGAIELTPLACVVALWPWDMLAGALEHLNRLGVTWGPDPDPLSGLDFGDNVRLNEAQYSALYQTRDEDMLLWKTQSDWHQTLAKIMHGQDDLAFVRGGVWDALAARLPKTFSLDGLDKVVAAFLAGGVSPAGADRFMAALAEWWSHDANRGIMVGIGILQQDALARRRPEDAGHLLALAGLDVTLAQLLQDGMKTALAAQERVSYGRIPPDHKNRLTEFGGRLDSVILGHAIPDTPVRPQLPRL
jgi:hypothetical protein